LKIRRLFAAILLAFVSAAVRPIPVDAQPAGGTQSGEIEQGLEIVLLGTAGGPPPHFGRSQPSTLLQVGGQSYLIDAGEGAAHQLAQARVRPLALDAVFITHLHWDHTLGLDYLMATEWMRGRAERLPIYGPPGLDFFISRQLAAVEVGEDIFRAQADARPPLSGLYPSHEVAGCTPSVVFQDSTVSVTAICNSHFAEVRAPAHAYGIDLALSYRFDTKHGSVTFTGDTGPSRELEQLAKGSDVLVAEIVDLSSIERALKLASPQSDTSVLMQHMAHQHLTAEEVGKLAASAGVKKLVLTHLVIGADFDPQSFAEQVRPHFSGEIIVGRDLLRVVARSN
jgi:ribonuclease BN (tRNA processing enzyme)